MRETHCDSNFLKTKILIFKKLKEKKKKCLINEFMQFRSLCVGGFHKLSGERKDAIDPVEPTESVLNWKK